MILVIHEVARYIPIYNILYIYTYIYIYININYLARLYIYTSNFLEVVLDVFFDASLFCFDDNSPGMPTGILPSLHGS